jgi:hypothetical protein
VWGDVVSGGGAGCDQTWGSTCDTGMQSKESSCNGLKDSSFINGRKFVRGFRCSENESRLRLGAASETSRVLREHTPQILCQNNSPMSALSSIQ